MKKYSKVSVLCLLLVMVVWHGGWAQTDPPVGENWRPRKGKFEELADKAEERDVLARRVIELEETIQQLEEALESVPGQTPGQLVRQRPSMLEDLEKKAFKYETLRSELERKDNEIVSLTDDLNECQASSSNQEREMAKLRMELEKLSRINAEYQETQKSLQRSIEQLLLGHYEYYEVKKGDTLETIAASDLVYGDSTKAEWLRQANRRRVMDLDELMPGEMLIVPRFPPSGRYEF
jgi:DNA repair exonuclease SbcCD ATPase subunit